MSKIGDIRKHNKGLNMSIIDIVSILLEKSKYVELFTNLFKNKLNRIISDEDWFDDFFNRNGLEGYAQIKELSRVDKFLIFRFIENILDVDDLLVVNEFKRLNEKNLIKQNDISRYESFDDLRNQVTNAKIYENEKELESTTIKIYDTEEWLLIKPLSWESSKKYGANTKWCTTSRDTSDYFLKYAGSGVLIYIINKRTGYRVACFNNESEGLSFWNQQDTRIDSMITELTPEIFSFLKKHFQDDKLRSNFSYLSGEEKFKLESEYNRMYGELIEPPIYEINRFNRLTLAPEEVNIQYNYTYEQPINIENTTVENDTGYFLNTSSNTTTIINMGDHISNISNTNTDM